MLNLIDKYSLCKKVLHMYLIICCYINWCGNISLNVCVKLLYTDGDVYNI